MAILPRCLIERPSIHPLLAFLGHAARKALEQWNLEFRGDRYALKQGTFFKPEPDFELTLIEAEAIEALRREYSVELAAGEARRNIVTRDVLLNHLVGRDFMIGGVKVHGIRLCEPCSHLEGLTGSPVIKALRHRGGLRAQILTQGVIRVGDAVTEPIS